MVYLPKSNRRLLRCLPLLHPIFPNLAFGDTYILCKLPMEFKFATREVKLKAQEDWVEKNSKG